MPPKPEPPKPQQGAPTPANGDKIWLGEPRTLSPNFKGRSLNRSAIAGGYGQPLATATGSFYPGGLQDLVVGYGLGNGGSLVLYRSNLDAFAPQSHASFLAIANQQYPDPFLPDAKVIDIPLHPDFIAVGDFDGDGHTDIAVASKTTAAIYLFSGDGLGNFSAPQILNLDSAVTALTTYSDRSGQFSALLAGTVGTQKPLLTIFKGSDFGLMPLLQLAMPGAVTDIDIGNLDGDRIPDAALVAGGKLFVLPGSSLQPGHRARLLSVNVPGTVTSVILGSFIFDRESRAQIAAVTSDGSVHFLVHDSFDPRSFSAEERKQMFIASAHGRPNPVVPPANPNESWRLIESVPGIAGQSLVFRTRISSNAADDLMVANTSSGQISLITHPNAPQGANTFLPGRVIFGSYPVAATRATSMRVNADGRPGLVLFGGATAGPTVMMPLPDPTFTVNTTADTVDANPGDGICADAGGKCSLRAAIMEANANVASDTVMVPAGTYQLTLTGPDKETAGETDTYGSLDIFAAISVVGDAPGGTDATATVIEAGTSTSNGIDKVFSVNPNGTLAFDSSFSNLTIKFGKNPGTFGGGLVLPHGFGGGFFTELNGTSNTTLTNVIVDSNSTVDGDGGGIAVDDQLGGTGVFTMNGGSLVQNNTVNESSTGGPGIGGGIWVGSATAISLSACQIKNNNATQVTGIGGGNGGGIFIFNPSNTHNQSVIHGCTISGNHAAGEGGGIFTGQGLLIDNTGGAMVIDSNTAVEGGGLWTSLNNETTTVTKATITNNSATGTGNPTTGIAGGGGIFSSSNGATGSKLVMHFSRLAGNSSSAAGGVGINLESMGTATSTANVTNNWWGTNTPAATIKDANGSVTFDPFVVLTHTASPNKLKINQSSTLTADLGHDNHGSNGALAGNLQVIAGLSVTFDSAVLGTIPQAQPETLGGSATATATFNAGGTGGLGKANATVDQAVAGVGVNAISSATEVGSTVTITTVGKHGLSNGDNVIIAGVGVGGYNGTFTVTGTGLNTFTYTTTAGLAPSSGGTATAALFILQPPSIAKSFNPTTIQSTSFNAGAVSTITFTITNSTNPVPINASFTDTLPSNVGGSLLVASTPNVVNNCGGTVTATAGTNTISFLNNTLPVGVCTIKVDVSSANDNTYSNSVTIDSTDAGNGNTSSANLKVINPPTISKAFGASTIPLNGTTSLTFTISNPNANAASVLNGISFTDTLPNAAPGTLVVATPNNLTNTCSTTPTATPGSGSISLTGATLPAGASCTISVNVLGTVGGAAPNGVTVSDTVAGTGNTSTATVTVVAPPTISKAFGAASVPLNGTTTVTFTISNPNTTAAGDLTGVAFSDTLPNTTGTLVVAATPGVVNTCNGTVTATAGTGVISLSGGSVFHNTSCTVTVNVTGVVEGDANNTTGAITSTEGGTGTTSNTATLKIVAPPTISKAFGAANIPLNGTTTVTFTITNPATNTTAETGIAFSDTLTNGLQVASTPGVTNTCGGTVTAVSNSTSISLTGGSIATPGSTCTIVVNVTGTQSGTVSNTTGAISSTNGGTGATSNTATLIVAAPATVTKNFGATTIPLNGTTSMTITITNPNTTVALTGLSFTDSLPAGLVVATPNGLTNTCGGTATATAGSGIVSLSGGSVAASASCTVSVNVQGTIAGDKNNSVTVTSTEGGASTPATATVTVVAPPAISKAFGAGSIPLNGTTTVTFTISNPNNPTTPANGDLTGVSFSDTLPVSGGAGSATLVVSGTPNVTNTCGGTVTATAGTGVISLTGGSVAHNTSCTISVDVKGTVEGDANNTTGAISSTEGGTGTTSNTALLKVVAPPTISKAFGAANITLNGTTTVTFTITNPASNTSQENGIAFSDTLTNGLQVASTPGVSNTCGGTVTAAANSTSISLTGGSIATPGATCTIVVNVTGTQSGTVTNTTGAVSSTNGGTGATSNTATLIVASPATVTKVFGATKIPLNGTTSLTINITNPNTNVSLTGLSFTDSLPAGLIVATPNALTNTCGGTATATAGSGTVSLSGGTVASSASCAVSVNVQGTTAGDKNNSVTVSSTEGGASTPATATVTVVAPPTISKAFGAGSIPLNGTTTVTFTISNPNNPASPTNGDLTGVAFSDTLPVSGGPGSATLVVSGTPNVTNTCGGTVTATAGSGVISLSGGSVAHNASCTISVDVRGTVEGDANNTTGAISSTEGGTGTTSNTATLKVVAPPTISKAFGAANISLNGTTTVTFTITNPASNTSAENGIAFSDTLTNGLQVASTPGVSNTCGGTVTAAANSTSISLTGGSIATPGATCTIVVNVTGTQAGTVTNTTGAVSSTNGGTGATSNTATLFVASPANVTKSFGAASISQGGTTSLTINISNPNTTVPFTGMAFTDNLPAGLVIAPTPNLSNTCGGTATAVAGSGSLSLSGGTLAANGLCAVSVNVQGTSGGVKNNSVVVSTTEGGASAAATASITVVGAPSLVKAFGAASIPLNGTTSLTFTISNANASNSLSGIGFTDTLPAGLIIATPNGLANSCSGTVTATQGTNSISLSGASLAASGSCQFSVNVTGTAAGTQNNTTSTVSSVEGGTGAAASASINVDGPPSIAKAFNPSGIQPNGVSSLTFTITNPAANPDQALGVAFTDSLPANVVVATPNGLSNTCGGTPTATSGSGTISLTGGTIAVNSSCAVTVNVTSSVTGTYLNTSGNVSSTNGGTGNTASDTLFVAFPPTISKLFLPTTVVQGGTTLLSFTITNPNGNGTPAPSDMTLTGIAFTDTLPAGLVVANPPNISNDCDGTVTAVAGSNTITLTGGDLSPLGGLRPIQRRFVRRAPTSNGSCFISLSVQATGGPGTYNNTSGPISANESGPGASSNTASLTVTAPPVAPTVSKGFSPTSINLGATSTLTLTFTNPNATDLVNVSLNDTFPAGVKIADPTNTGTCAANITGLAGGGTLGISIPTLTASSSCTVIVTVQGVTAGSWNNTTGAITAQYDSGGGTLVTVTGTTSNTASLTVLSPVLAITKTHAGNFMQGQTNASYTITVSNTGTAPTVGTVTVSDPLPASLTPTSVSGTGWTCAAANTAFPCTRSDVLNNGSAYPPITAVVKVSFTAPASVTNTATVSGGGDPASHSASDPTTITPLVITVTATPTSATITAGQSATYNITATANGTLPGPINLSISGVPPASLFVTSPPSGPAPLSATLNIFTTAQTAAKGLAPLSRTVETALAMLFAFPLVVLMTPRSRLRKLRRGRWLGMWFVLLLVFGMAACGGGSGFTGGGNHTPPGTYTITITGMSGPISGQTTVTLTVK